LLRILVAIGSLFKASPAPSEGGEKKRTAIHVFSTYHLENYAGS